MISTYFICWLVMLHNDSALTGRVPKVGGIGSYPKKWCTIICNTTLHSVVCRDIRYLLGSYLLQAAMERVLGTVTGGMLGFLLAICNDALPPIAQPFITVLAAACVAFTSIILGSKFKIDYAGRLFIMTFVLVAMATPNKRGKAFVCPMLSLNVCNRILWVSQ